MTAFAAEYCPHCGTELSTRDIEGRERRYCESCERVVWRNPVPTAGVAVVSDDGVLLTERAIEPGVGKWSVPGGHLEFDETPAAAAARELHEETGVRVDPADLELLDTLTIRSFEGKQVVSVGYAVRREDTSGDPVAGSETGAVGWFTPESFAASGETMHDPHGERFERAWKRLG